jgi:hypothetical protein
MDVLCMLVTVISGKPRMVLAPNHLPLGTRLCTGIGVCLQATAASLTCQTPKDAPIGLALDFLLLDCFLGRWSSGHPQSMLSLTHS